MVYQTPFGKRIRFFKWIWWSYYSRVIENKDGTWFTSGLDADSCQKLIKQFWNDINNRQKVSINLLRDDDVEVYKKEDDQIIVIHVPMARREENLSILIIIYFMEHIEEIMMVIIIVHVCKLKQCYVTKQKNNGYGSAR